MSMVGHDSTEKNIVSCCEQQTRRHNQPTCADAGNAPTAVAYAQLAYIRGPLQFIERRSQLASLKLRSHRMRRRAACCRSTLRYVAACRMIEEPTRHRLSCTWSDLHRPNYDAIGLRGCNFSTTEVTVAVRPNRIPSLA